MAPTTELENLSLIDLLQSQLQVSLDIAHSLPGPSDISFERSISSQVAGKLDETTSKAFGIIDGLMKLVEELDRSADSSVSSSKRLSKKAKGKQREEEDLIDNFHQVVEVVDVLLERTDLCLDTLTGKFAAPTIPIVPTETARTANSSLVNALPKGNLPKSITDAAIPKPQRNFTIPVDNSSSVLSRYKDPTRVPGWKKWNATVPVGYVDPEAASLADGSATEPVRKPRSLSFQDEIVPPHPYAHELAHLRYPDFLLRPTLPIIPILPSTFDDTPFNYISTKEQLIALVEELKKSPHIAIDLEHHSHRTYQGFLCLMQISTRLGGDWVVDLLSNEVRDNLGVLGEVFSDPSIVKIFHGAESDIVWLEQDFSLYIVNLFDTYHATKVLAFQNHSLASLLQTYCDFTPDKRYQMADWRIRPLPKEMLYYARSDTHYLIYVFENLLKSLVEKSTVPAESPSDLLVEVLKRSKETSMRRYTNSPYSVSGLGQDGWLNLARKWQMPAITNPTSLSTKEESEVFKAVHLWRDQTARKEDESLRFVLANHQLFSLASNKPTTGTAVLKVVQPASYILKSKADELAKAIEEALERAQELTGTGMDFDVGSDVEGLIEKLVDKVENAQPAVVKEESLVLDLWGPSSISKPVQSVASLQKVTSSLFGPTSKVSSSLFGSSLCHQPAATTKPENVTATKAERFRLLSEKISSSITRPPAPTPVEEPQLTPTPASPSLVEPEQVPFVPISSRLQPSSTSVPATNEIVTVGKPAKKRKRTGFSQKTKDSPIPETQASDEKPQAEKVFDYSTVPNGLDPIKNGAAGDDGGAFSSSSVYVKKVKKVKKPIVEFGNFPKPPKNMVENQKGARSGTF